jgi:hypothetical protein
MQAAGSRATMPAQTGGRRMPRALRVTMLVAILAPVTAWAESPAAAAPAVDAGLDLRYRFEHVEQDGIENAAEANTVRIRANLATQEFRGFSATLELDHVAAIGAERFHDTRNGMTEYPVVADPGGTDLNQAWIQFAPRADTRFRLGRQRINLDGERFVGSSAWRQNEQTLDAFRVETTALPGTAVNYAFVGRVNRIYGPDSGAPPEDFEGATHLLNARWTPAPATALVAYAYLLEFDEAPQLSSNSAGLRYEGAHALKQGWSLGWALEYARQRDAGGNPLRVDASYALLELHLKVSALDFYAGHERLSGERGTFDPASSPAFQTPLATLHKWQGWADKFLTTPPAGIDDSYAGAAVKRDHWRTQVVWHDFSAEATGLHYGSEVDVLLAFMMWKRYEVLLKLADYLADEGFTDTRKAWLQFSAAF